MFASDFVKLLDAFNTTQHVKHPSHDKGHCYTHTLNATTVVTAHTGSCDLPWFQADDVNLVDFAISAHNVVLFQVPPLSPDP